MNNAASIRARLNNISRKENIAFQVIIVRYLHERLLYRLSISEHADRFCLKGGNFIYALQGLSTRPTMDIDLLAKSIRFEVDTLMKAFRDIAGIACDDGAWFNTENIRIEPIAAQNIYSGIRLSIPAGFDTIKQNLQIDIGFGDLITPEAIKLQYPVLLDDLPAPVLSAYTPETVIAEKFHAMIFLSGANSRMKDFYDVHHLLSSGNYILENLEKAIRVTFMQRKTFFVESHELFTEGFATDNQRNRIWQAFLKKINQPASLTFPEVLLEVTHVLKPIWETIPKE